jgi:hypothetical protein
VTDLTLNEFKYLPKGKIIESLNLEREHIYNFVPDQLMSRPYRKCFFRGYFSKIRWEFMEWLSNVHSTIRNCWLH